MNERLDTMTLNGLHIQRIDAPLIWGGYSQYSNNNYST